MLALAADIRGLVIPPVLAAISFGWFETGCPGSGWGRWSAGCWRVGIVAGAIGVGTIAYYAANVPTRHDWTRDWGLLGPLASSMIGTAFTTGILGGPWSWLSPQAPAAFADPPQWLAHLSWVVLAGVVAHAYLTRRRTVRAWALLLFCLVVLLVLLWSSRAPYVGPIAGAEYRYLTEPAALSALALGLAYLPLPGAPAERAPRDTDVHATHAGRGPLAHATRGRRLRRVVLDRVRPHLARPLAPRDYVRIARRGPRRDRARGARRHRRACGGRRPHHLVGGPSAPPGLHCCPPSRASRTRPTSWRSSTATAVWTQPTCRSSGPPCPARVEDCGWKVDNGSAGLPLDGPVIDGDWWLRVSYLAEQASPMTVQLGSEGESVTRHSARA